MSFEERLFARDDEADELGDSGAYGDSLEEDYEEEEEEEEEAEISEPGGEGDEAEEEEDKPASKGSGNSFDMKDVPADKKAEQKVQKALGENFKIKRTLHYSIFYDTSEEDVGVFGHAIERTYRSCGKYCKALGVPISEVFDTLQAYFGNLYINDFVKFGRVYRVQTEAEAQYRSRPEDIAKIYVRAQSEQGTSMIPLDAVVTTEFTSGPDPVTHFNGYNAALVLGGAAPGYSSGQALDALKRVAEEVLVPKGYALDWSGISYQERQVGTQSVQAFAFGLLMVFLVLAAQYESWSIPLVVNMAVPFGIFGALAAVWIRGITNDIFFQIGLVTLIGLSAKNAILIVEFVNKRYQAGLPVVDAALEGATLRFRPIIMTSMAFIMGVTPLVLATGAGAAGRHSIGTGVFGGMLAETFLAIFFTPVFFVLNRKLADLLSRRRTEGKTPLPAEPSASGGP